MASSPRHHEDPPPHASKHEAPLPPFEAPAKTVQPGPGGYGPTIGVLGKPIDDGEDDPDTIAGEQRRRSAEMEKVGVEAYMKAHSAPAPDEAPKQVSPPPTKK